MAEATARDRANPAMIYQHLVTMPNGERKVLTASRQLDSDTIGWMTGGSLESVQTATEADTLRYLDAWAELDLANRHDAVPYMGSEHRSCE